MRGLGQECAWCCQQHEDGAWSLAHEGTESIRGTSDPASSLGSACLFLNFILFKHVKVERDCQSDSDVVYYLGCVWHIYSGFSVASSYQLVLHKVYGRLPVYPLFLLKYLKAGGVFDLRHGGS